MTGGFWHDVTVAAAGGLGLGIGLGIVAVSYRGVRRFLRGEDMDK